MKNQNVVFRKWPDGQVIAFLCNSASECALLMADGETIDAQSTRENYRQVLRALRDALANNWPDKQWQPVGVFVHWESEPLICAHSGRPIESAYGIPDYD